MPESGGIASLTFQTRDNGGKGVVFIGNFMVYQDRIETGCLQFDLLFLKST